MCLLLCVWKKNVSNSHKTLQPLSLNDHKKTSQWPCSKSKLKRRVKVTSFANIGIEKKIFEEFLLLLRFCCMHFKCQDYPTEATHVKKLGYRHWDMWRNWDIANTLTNCDDWLLGVYLLIWIWEGTDGWIINGGKKLMIEVAASWWHWLGDIERNIFDSLYSHIVLLLRKVLKCYK